jgi:hypothetical protein
MTASATLGRRLDQSRESGLYGRDRIRVRENSIITVKQTAVGLAVISKKHSSLSAYKVDVIPLTVYSP